MGIEPMSECWELVIYSVPLTVRMTIGQRLVKEAKTFRASESPNY
jgi:hypothetical protein